MSGFEDQGTSGNAGVPPPAAYGLPGAGPGTRVRIYFGESDRSHGKALWLAFLEYLHDHGAAGATVLRGIGGFGAHSRIHTAMVFELSGDLPLVLEWVDTDERVAALLPALTAMLDGGLVTTDPTTIVRYTPHRNRQARSAP